MDSSELDRLSKNAPRHSIAGFVRLIGDVKRKSGRHPQRAFANREYAAELVLSVARATHDLSDVTASDRAIGNPDYLGALFGVDIYIRKQAEDIVFD